MSQYEHPSASTNNKPLRVAVIGGGISGLAAAYHLTQPDGHRTPCEVTIYEATDHLGGNASTVKLRLGEIRDVLLGDEREKPGPRILERWADLGVDDFNRKTYKRIVDVMAEIDFTDYRPLEDTACFFSSDGRKALTADGELHHGTSDPRVRIPEALNAVYFRFMRAAAKAVQEPRYHHYTVKQFVSEYIHNDKKEYNEKAQTALLENMRDNLLYPRISAMYFVDDSGPEGMPLRSVMGYYILQEGFNKDSDQPPRPNRNYFVKGAQAWINCLADWLKKERGVSFIKNARAEVFASAGGVTVSLPPQAGQSGLAKPVRYDKVVMAAHADDTLRSIKQGMTQTIADVLGKIRYTNSIAVAHTFAGVLPADRNAWRTYNVTIREGAGLKPYRMSYVMNRLQNDAAKWLGEGPGGKPEIQTTPYNQFGLPQFFVSLNPAPPVPDEYVLRTVNQEGQTPGGYRKHFSEDEQHLPGWQAIDETDDRAIGWFKHNLLDFNCLDAQEELSAAQGGEHNNLYFTGGWCKGAGLHEECWLMGEQVAKCVYGESGDDEHIFRPLLSNEEYAPRYWREAHLDDGKCAHPSTTSNANDSRHET